MMEYQHGADMFLWHSGVDHARAPPLILSYHLHLLPSATRARSDRFVSRYGASTSHPGFAARPVTLHLPKMQALNLSPRPRHRRSPRRFRHGASGFPRTCVDLLVRTAPPPQLPTTHLKKKTSRFLHGAGSSPRTCEGLLVRIAHRHHLLMARPPRTPASRFLHGAASCRRNTSRKSAVKVTTAASVQVGAKGPHRALRPGILSAAAATQRETDRLRHQNPRVA
mmetsp:Transcript_75854/g.190855  ORF Transcript_75854/g.190855 Transcript_75854/m.190855 type:complete len:224 (+) Transcript_75854:1908-2579(+)